jgi:hypothetical protein
MYLGSKNRMTPRTVHQFAGASLEQRFARAVCAASVLPRKEWFEASAMLRRIQRKADTLLGEGTTRIVDVGAGHGLLGMLLALVDKREREVLLVEPHPPPSRAKLLDAVRGEFPWVGARVKETHTALDSEVLRKGDLVVSAHGCGGLTDAIIAAAMAVRAHVVVLPCCHPRKNAAAQVLAGFVDPALALDSARALRLHDAGYQVWTASIDPTITPKNRLILAAAGA